MAARTRRLACESLEARSTPATFGIPWADASQLTLSFAPEGTVAAGHTSTLASTLAPHLSVDQWQRTIAQALQTWASHSNINIAYVQDHGTAFGVPGLEQGDPRFGDIRIGAHAMAADVLAVAAPHDPAAAGTLGGDIFLNADYAFDSDPYDLFSVMLHEGGHALGLASSTDPNSPMFERFNNTKTRLTSGDIAKIKALYGTRAPDSYEAGGNATRALAKEIPEPANYLGETPLVAFGDLQKNTDVDFFKFETDDDDNEFTVRLQSRGLSLLAPRVTVYDEAGVALATAASTSALGDVLTLSFEGGEEEDEDDRTYFLKVDTAERTVFGVGAYGLSVRFDGKSTDTDAEIDAVLRGPNRALGADAIAALFRDPAGTYYAADGGSNETVATASILAPTPGFPAKNHHQAVASIESAGDKDVYRFKTAAASRPVLTATVWTRDPRGLVPRLRLLDATGAEVAATVLTAANGRYTLQVPNAPANRFLYLEVGRSAGTGNYLVSLELGTVASTQENFATSTIAAGATARTFQLYVARAQLFQFVQHVAGPAGTVATTIKKGTQTKLSFQTAAGSRSGGAVMLTPGAYTVRMSGTGVTGGPLTVRIDGSALSDPIGPVRRDPTMNPVYVDPADPTQYHYPDNTRTRKPYRAASVAV